MKSMRPCLIKKTKKNKNSLISQFLGLPACRKYFVIVYWQSVLLRRNSSDAKSSATSSQVHSSRQSGPAGFKWIHILHKSQPFQKSIKLINPPHTLFRLVKSHTNGTGNKRVNTSSVVWSLSNSMHDFSRSRSLTGKQKPSRSRFSVAARLAVERALLRTPQKHKSACKSGPLMIHACLNNHLTATVERVPDENINNRISCQRLMMELNVGRMFDNTISHS